MTTREVKMRSASHRDLEVLSDVLLAANRELAEVWPEWFFRAYMAELLEIEERMAQADVLVAELGEEVVGSITWYTDASREVRGWPLNWGGIRALAVAPERRGCGVGKLLARHCVGMGRQGGCSAIGLHTADAMRAAASVYKGLGFIRDSRFDVSGAELFAVESPLEDVLVKGYRLDLAAEPAPGTPILGRG